MTLFRTCSVYHAKERGGWFLFSDSSWDRRGTTVLVHRDNFNQVAGGNEHSLATIDVADPSKVWTGRDAVRRFAALPEA